MEQNSKSFAKSPVRYISNLVKKPSSSKSSLEDDESNGFANRNKKPSWFGSIKKKLKSNKFMNKKVTDHTQVYVDAFTQNDEEENMTPNCNYPPPVPPRCNQDTDEIIEVSLAPPIPPRIPEPPQILNLESSSLVRVPEYLDVTELNVPSEVSRRTVLANEKFNLARYGWFWGPLTRTEAAERLRDQPDGSFLIRDSSSDRYIFTLSFRSYGKTLHCHIQYNCGVFSIGDQQGSTVAELILKVNDISKEKIFSYSSSENPAVPHFPVRLIKPVSRFTEVRSLQYLCRFLIRQFINVNNIDKLPLPEAIKGYLQQGQY